jgi:peptide/nickel transport system ATP-binding protein
MELTTPSTRNSKTGKDSSAALLDVRDLSTYLLTYGGVLKAVDHLSFQLRDGETLALVGESGSGKSMAALSLMRLLPDPPARIVGGSILFQGTDLLNLSELEMEAIRGDEMSMVFQEPMTSLNPVLTIGEQIAEPLRLHRNLPAHSALALAIELLDKVRVPDARTRIGDYPHRLSGGMRQRVMIAMALACEPKVLIADEPTTALDVTIQAQVLDLLSDLQREARMAMLLITHDFGVVAEMADRVVVMYAGRKVEEAPVEELFARPRHPYTQGLLASAQRFGQAGARKARLPEIPGVVPSLLDAAPGCAFADRCTRAMAQCRSEAPKLRQLGSDHSVACFAAEE